MPPFAPRALAGTHLKPPEIFRIQNINHEFDGDLDIDFDKIPGCLAEEAEALPPGQHPENQSTSCQTRPSLQKQRLLKETYFDILTLYV